MTDGTIIYAKDLPWEKWRQDIRNDIFKAFPYPWAEEMATEEFHKNSKKEVGGTAPFRPKPAPLSLVYEIMEYIFSRPEIIDCYKMMGKNEDIPPIIPHFGDYLDHKYGNDHFGNQQAKAGAFYTVHNNFTGLHDPALRDFLTEFKKFVTDDGYRYGG